MLEMWSLTYQNNLASKQNVQTNIVFSLSCKIPATVTVNTVLLFPLLS